MFNPDAGRRRSVYSRTSDDVRANLRGLEPGYPGVIRLIAQLSLENVATSDATYHDVDDTIMVTLVGQEILRGRHISVGRVTPPRAASSSFTLCHDIGYVRGICQGDSDGSFAPTSQATR